MRLTLLLFILVLAGCQTTTSDGETINVLSGLPHSKEQIAMDAFANLTPAEVIAYRELATRGAATCDNLKFDTKFDYRMKNKRNRFLFQNKEEGKKQAQKVILSFQKKYGLGDKDQLKSCSAFEAEKMNNSYLGAHFL